MSNNIFARGGDSSGGEARTAVVDPNTLRSKSYAKILNLLGSGEWEEVCVGGLRGLYLDGVAAQNTDGSSNFSDLSVVTRNGSLGQSRITGVGDTTETAQGVGVALLYNNPIERVLPGTDIDLGRVTVAVPRLSSTDLSNGDVHGSFVEYKIEYNSSDNTAWRTVYEGTDFLQIDKLGNPVTNYHSYNVHMTVEPLFYLGNPHSTEGSDVEYDKYWLPSLFTVEYNKNNTGWVLLSQTVIAFDGDFFIGSIPSNTETDVISFRYSVVPAVQHVGEIFPEFVDLYAYGHKVIQTGIQRIEGKTTSTYEKQTTFRLTGTGPFNVRVTRLTQDSTSEYLQNALSFSAIAGVMEEKLRYPGSVLVGMSFDASQFPRIPTMSFDCKMLKVKVPVSYNPITRTYSGVWNGAFKIAWTDNPAWCFYDLLTNKRHGLGDRIPESYVDKWELYQIAQYCDEYVAGEDGTLEPRFTCNVIIQTQREAVKVLQDFASVFRGMTYWGAGTVVPVQDRPKDASYVFSNANVVDGVFNYQSSAQSTRYNAVSVTWNDPTNQYKQAVEYVEDTDAIAAMGYINKAETVAFGCTSKAMAKRVGRWMLYTNNYETDVVSFTTGLEGAIPRPSDIIQISDSLRSTVRLSGRVVAADLDTLTLDTAITFTGGVTYTVAVIDIDGGLQESTFTYSGSTNTIELTTPFAKAVAKDSVYSISDDTTPVALFRVLSVVEKTEGFEITALSYDPNKYTYVEQRQRVPDVTNPVNYNAPVTDLKAQEILYIVGRQYMSKILASWTPSLFGLEYYVTIKSSDGRTWSGTTNGLTYELPEATVGNYEVSVVARNVLGQLSSRETTTVSVVGRVTSPADVTGLSLVANNGMGVISWDLHPDLDVRNGGYIIVKYTDKTTNVKWEDGTVVARVAGSSTQALVPLMSGTYTVKAVDAFDYYSKNFASTLSNFAEVMNTDVMATLVESPTFPGVKTNCFVDGGNLVLSGEALWDSIPDFDAALDVDTAGVSTLQATYEFSDVIDLSDIYTVRLYSTVNGFAYVVSDTIASRTSPVRTWPRFGGVVVDTAKLNLYVSTTLDDPASPAANWTNWSIFVLSDYTARGFKFKLEMSIEETTHALEVSTLAISVDAVDRVLGEDNVSIPDTGFSVVFNGAFVTTPAIAISIDNMQTGDYYRITSKSAEGFTATVYNASNVAVARQIDWIAKGYGRRAV